MKRFIRGFTYIVPTKKLSLTNIYAAYCITVWVDGVLVPVPACSQYNVDPGDVHVLLKQFRACAS